MVGSGIRGLPRRRRAYRIRLSRRLMLVAAAVVMSGGEAARPTGALAASLHVVRPGGHVVVRSDRFLAADAMTPSPAADALAPAPLVMTHRRSPTVRGVLAGFVRRGQISAAVYAAERLPGSSWNFDGDPTGMVMVRR
jgi:hypothetical protein